MKVISGFQDIPVCDQVGPSGRADIRIASSSAVTAVEVQAAVDDTRDRQESTPVKHDFTTVELEQTSVDGPVKSAPDNFIRSWWREILAIMLSIASLLSTAGVLFAYQNQPLSSWNFRYLPNTVVSQLTTISRSALMLSTASCVSQLSWLHIQEKPRALSELQTFDNASRGPAGAIAMLAFPTRYRIPALIGSLITIATLLMEPFVQQVLQFPLRDEIVKGNATFPTTQIYAPVPEAAIDGMSMCRELPIHDGVPLILLKPLQVSRVISRWIVRLKPLS